MEPMYVRNRGLPLDAAFWSIRQNRSERLGLNLAEDQT
jgi:hypothetical protein